MPKPGAPKWPEDAYEIAKCDVLQCANQFFALELHVATTKSAAAEDQELLQMAGAASYRVFTHQGVLSDTTGGMRECRYVNRVEEAEALYASLYTKLVRTNAGYVKSRVVAAECRIGSDRAIKDRENTAANALPAKVQALVELMYREANSRLFNSINDYYIGKLSLAQLEKAEAILLQLVDTIDAKAKSKTDGAKPASAWAWNDEVNNKKEDSKAVVADEANQGDQVEKLSAEFYDAIKEKEQPVLSSIEAVAEKLELVQLMKDMIKVR